MELAGFLMVAAFFGAAGVILWGVVCVIRAIRGVGHQDAGGWSRDTFTHDSAPLGGMNEGDVHSGPHGYSPVTAYPETQYGSGFDPAADWNEEEQ